MPNLQKNAIGKTAQRDVVLSMPEEVIEDDGEIFTDAPKETIDDVTRETQEAEDRFQKLLNSMVQDQVAEAVERAMAEAAKKTKASSTTQLITKSSTVPVPPSYKKHYRCDVSPNLKIQQLNMAVLPSGGDPRKFALAGKWIKFRFGHLYTSDDKVIAQIEWMRKRKRSSPDGTVTYGGNQSIYEDDGSKLYRCLEGCEYITASYAGWKAHMTSTHGYEFEEGE